MIYFNLPILSPLDLRHNLIKYNNETDIKHRFPYFLDYVDANNKTYYINLL